MPDIPGFVVNRLLFPYLFSAVELMAETGIAAEDVDSCMTLGAGMPMGPLALLDFVGLDVSQAIGEAIGATVPGRLRGAGRRRARSGARSARLLQLRLSYNLRTSQSLRLVQVREPDTSCRDVPHSSTSSPEARSRPVPSGPASIVRTAGARLHGPG